MSQDKNTTQTQPTSAENTRTRPVIAPPVDIYENAGEYLVLADLPGVAGEDVQIRYENGELTIRATREDRGVGQVVGAEFTAADYARRFSIPETVDADKIDAKLVQGVLHLTLPKAGRAKPRQIAVKVG